MDDPRITYYIHHSRESVDRLRGCVTTHFANFQLSIPEAIRPQIAITL